MRVSTEQNEQRQATKLGSLIGSRRWSRAVVRGYTVLERIAILGESDLVAQAEVLLDDGDHTLGAVSKAHGATVARDQLLDAVVTAASRRIGRGAL